MRKDAMLTPSIFYCCRTTSGIRPRVSGKGIYFNALFLHRDEVNAFRPRLEFDLYPERIEWAKGQTIQSLLNQVFSNP